MVDGNRPLLIGLPLVFAIVLVVEAASPRPHVIFILADDLGFNDVGFHGSGQIPTPNIDALAYNGVILNNYYVNPLCTPSRSALMTGKYPYHIGMQHLVLLSTEPRGLPLSEKLLPQYLKDLGYVNRAIGKWHLGFYKTEYTPMHRGFDSHLGYWYAFHDYFDHTIVTTGGAWGFDIRNNMSVGWDFHGQYSTDLFTNEAVRLINEHDTEKPLFLYLAHTAVHSANEYDPLPAPDEEVAKFSDIDDFSRRKFAAMMSKLDQSVGQVVQALQNRSMLENSIIIFSTDNGGAVTGIENSAGSNYPLKGSKYSVWEGGVRGAACIWSPLIKKPSRVSTQYMQIADWLPTLLDAVGGNANVSGLDGMSIWDSIVNDTDSPRTEILHNIDDIDDVAALTVGSYKLVKGYVLGDEFDRWFGPSGRDYDYNTSLVSNSPVALALKSVNASVEECDMLDLRDEATVDCGDAPQTKCDPYEASCLFNIDEDPCEYNNLADQMPDKVEELETILAEYNGTAVPAANLPRDPKGDPRLWNHVLTTFGDNETMARLNSF